MGYSNWTSIVWCSTPERYLMNWRHVLHFSLKSLASLILYGVYFDEAVSLVTEC